jgi:hypothetical protein
VGAVKVVSSDPNPRRWSDALGIPTQERGNEKKLNLQKFRAQNK